LATVIRRTIGSTEPHLVFTDCSSSWRARDIECTLLPHCARGAFFRRLQRCSLRWHSAGVKPTDGAEVGLAVAAMVEVLTPRTGDRDWRVWAGSLE
jgi:hypothetical protein